MSLAEMKENARQLTAGELEDLTLHVEFLRRAGDPARQEEMARRTSSGGRLHAQEEVMALHERLDAEGR